MNNRYKYRLNQKKSKSDINEDSFTKVLFGGERRLLPVGEINHVVDLGEEYNKERNSTPIYRLQGTITPIFSNVLMNPNESGGSVITPKNNGLNTFDNDLFKKDIRGTSSFGKEDLTYPESYKKYLKELNGWFGFYEPDIAKEDTLCSFYDIEPTRNRFDLNSSLTRLTPNGTTTTDKNWELTITYPYDSDSGHTITNNGTRNGLLIVGTKAIIVGGKDMIAVASSAQHGLETGDKVSLFDFSASPSEYNKVFTVKRLGLDDGSYKENYFAIDLDPLTPITIGTLTGRMARLIGEQESVYYLRKFKKIINNSDYEMYPLAFSKSIYNDQNYQFVINNDINIEFDDQGNPITDNLGRPISELYVTFIKTDSDGMFGSLKSGLDLEYLTGNLIDEKISNVRKLNYDISISSLAHIPLEDNIHTSYTSLSKDWFYGDLVEYNKYSLEEVKLANVLHRFNTNNRENTTNNSSNLARGPRREGYIYNPHYLYKVRDFSTYIEQGDSSVFGVPDYREDLGDGRLLWRDFLDIGVSNGIGDELDYPFTNGAHYIHKNICFTTGRQDPFGGYGMYYNGTNIINLGGKATSTIDVATNKVNNINITNVGSKYEQVPRVTITPFGNCPGSGAIAIATINTNGELDTINITNGGNSYINPPIITIDSFDPPDPRGDGFTDKFQINSSQNVC